MPNRLRYLAISRNAANPLSGPRVHQLIQTVMNRLKLGAVPDWAKIDAAGKALGYWTHLQIWRERRGIPARHSVYRRASTHKTHTHPPTEFTRRSQSRTNSRNGWNLPTPRRPVRVTTPDVAVIRPPRPGIFG